MCWKWKGIRKNAQRDLFIFMMFHFFFWKHCDVNSELNMLFLFKNSERFQNSTEVESSEETSPTYPSSYIQNYQLINNLDPISIEWICSGFRELIVLPVSLNDVGKWSEKCVIRRVRGVNVSVHLYTPRWCSLLRSRSGEIDAMKRHQHTVYSIF